MSNRKKIRAAVVGVGYLGRFHAQKYSMIEDVTLFGVTDSDASRAREVAGETNTQAYPSYVDFFGKVDAVSIVTPTESHCMIGLEFLSRGIDVLIEKPVAVNTIEAEELVREAKRTESILQVGHLERFNGAVAGLKARVKDPVFIEAVRTSPFPNRSTDVDVVLDVMIHDIDIILDLVGSEVERIDAVGMPVVTGKADLAQAWIRFRNGCVAGVKASRVSRDKVRRIDVVQPGLSLSADCMNQSLTAAKTIPKKGGIPEVVYEDAHVDKKDSLLEELKSFIECSRLGKDPLVSGVDGKRALEVAERVQEAVRLSRGSFQ